jgi:D-alanyl-D-alanine dipeptidase
VVERLVSAQQLLPHGWRWLLVEGHRPPALRQRIFNDYAATLRRLHPEAPEVDIRTATTRWVATAATRWCAPMETAGHLAGGAIDLTVCTDDGTQADMGSPEAARFGRAGGRWGGVGPGPE